MIWTRMLPSIPNVNDIDYLLLIASHSNACCDAVRGVERNKVCPYQETLHATFRKENDEDVPVVKAGEVPLFQQIDV